MNNFLRGKFSTSAFDLNSNNNSSLSCAEEINDKTGRNINVLTGQFWANVTMEKHILNTLVPMGASCNAKSGLHLPVFAFLELIR